MPDSPREPHKGGSDKTNSNTKQDPGMAATHIHLPNHLAHESKVPIATMGAPPPRFRSDGIKPEPGLTPSPPQSAMDGPGTSAKLPSIHDLLAGSPPVPTVDAYRPSRNPGVPLADPSSLASSISYHPNPAASFPAPAPALLAPLEPSPRPATHLPPPNVFPSAPFPQHTSAAQPVHSLYAPHRPPVEPAIDPMLQQQQSPTQGSHPIYNHAPIDPNLASGSLPAPLARGPPQAVAPPPVAQFPLPPPLPVTSGAPPTLAPIASVAPVVSTGPPSPLNQTQYAAGVPSQASAQAPNTPTYTGPQSDRYTCEVCRKSFSRPSSLRIHMHSHTGEKPYICSKPGCGKAFSVRSNMKRHERGCHVGEPGHSSSQANGDGSSVGREDGDSMDGVEEEDEEDEQAEGAGSPNRSRRARS